MTLKRVLIGFVVGLVLISHPCFCQTSVIDDWGIADSAFNSEMYTLSQATNYLNDFYFNKKMFYEFRKTMSMYTAIEIVRQKRVEVMHFIETLRYSSPICGEACIKCLTPLLSSTNLSIIDEIDLINEMKSVVRINSNYHLTGAIYNVSNQIISAMDKYSESLKIINEIIKERASEKNGH